MGEIECIKITVKRNADGTISHMIENEQALPSKSFAKDLIDAILEKTKYASEPQPIEVRLIIE